MDIGPDLLKMAVLYIEQKWARIGTTVFCYEECLDPDDRTVIAVQSLPRPDEQSDDWAELTKLTILDTELLETHDRQEEYVVAVTAETTWTYWSDDESKDETAERVFYVTITVQEDGQLAVDRVEE